MPKFKAKTGAAGWPGPQTRQIEGWCKTYQINCDVHEAQTGTRYLTLETDEGIKIKVRVADHADAYATADYTVDPAQDQRDSVKQWIRENGSKTDTTSLAAARREYKKLRAQAPVLPLLEGGPAFPCITTKDGSVWYDLPETIDSSNSTDLIRLREQIANGHVE